MAAVTAAEEFCGLNAWAGKRIEMGSGEHERVIAE